MQTQDRTRVTIRAFTDDDYDAVAGLWNAQFPEFFQSGDELRQRDERRPAYCASMRWLAERSGAALGFAHCSQDGHTYDPHTFNIDLAVTACDDRAAIADQLHGAMMDALRSVNPAPTRLTTWSRIDLPWLTAFLERHGFTADWRMWASQLDLTTFEPAQFGDDVQSVIAQGITLRSLAELRVQDADFERKLYDMMVEIDRDVPSPPNIEERSSPFEEWRERFRARRPGPFEDGYLVAFDGSEYVAVSQLQRSPQPDVLRTGLTGVRRSHRRRGIAMAIKARSLSIAKEHGFRLVNTENASINTGMLTVNERLGFVKRPALVHYSVDLNDANATTH